ncbi:MAG: hypothetical protein WBQ86_05320 [Candidatus Binatus sp.]
MRRDTSRYSRAISRSSIWFGRSRLTLKVCSTARRVAGRFHEALEENLGSQVVGNSVKEFMQWIPDLPEDTAAWVLGEIE